MPITDRHSLTAAAAVEAGIQRIPVFDTVPAGLFKDASVVLDFEDVPSLLLTGEEANHDPQAFALVVQGDSMVEAGILDGDILVVSPGTRVLNGDIAVVCVNQTASTVKKVYVEDGRLVLQPANHRYRPEVLSYPQEVEILGKVIQVRRQIR
jgi:repressor LexA